MTAPPSGRVHTKSRFFRRSVVAPVFAAMLAACSPPAPEVTPQATKDSAGARPTALASVVVRDSALEQRVGRLELRLLERDAQIEELQSRLDEARQEVVRALAKLQTVASRAEAASAIAEAEVALQSRAATRAGGGSQPGSDLARATVLLRQGSAEFAKQNYGGALYLANQAKSIAGLGMSRAGGAGAGGPLRAGEVPFAVPLRLQSVARGNVREGPGSSYKVLFSVDAGTPLTGYSYVDQWVRVADASGRAGWMFRSLIGRREPDAPAP